MQKLPPGGQTRRHHTIKKYVRQSFWIGDTKVTVMELEGNSVLLSVDAPRATPVGDERVVEALGR